MNTSRKKKPFQVGERRTIPLSEFLAEASSRFGNDPNEWRFECVRCGGTQSAKEFMDLGLSEEDASKTAHYSCIGRIDSSRGCDWSLGGLFSIHTLEVERPDGDVVPCFELAPPPEVTHG